jgi:ferredoxin
LSFKVIADRDRCRGHGQCELFAPDVFEIDNEALVVVKVERPDASRRDDVEEAVGHCPEAAISIDLG